MPKSLPEKSSRKPRASAGRRRPAAARPTPPARSGRRPGTSGTREAILEAAQRQFAEFGYDRTSLRSVAKAAGVDQKLVAYFFGTKQELFIAAVEIPYDAVETIPRIFRGELSKAGEELARLMVSLLEEPETRAPIVAAVRAAAAEPEAARLLQDIRQRVLREFGQPIVDALGAREAELRVGLIHLQFDGLVMGRYITGAEPLASLPPKKLIAALAPVLQQCVSGPLPRR
jgi:AcrR family transcriptional regulator